MYKYPKGYGDGIDYYIGDGRGYRHGDGYGYDVGEGWSYIRGNGYRHGSGYGYGVGNGLYGSEWSCKNRYPYSLMEWGDDV